ncbi:MAG: HDIG domain-containing protein [Chloroflexi bacterium]|nr:HDIG domain-containing protein [Chloroflexota bacterium]
MAASSTASTLKLVVFVLVLGLLLTLVLAFHFIPSRYQMKEGEVSPYTLKSPVTKTFTSKVATERLREQAAMASPPVLVYRQQTLPEQLERLRTMGRQVSSVLEASQFDPQEMNRRLKQMGDIPLSPSDMDLALGFTPLQWQEVVSETRRLLVQALGERLAPQDTAQIKDGLREKINPQLEPPQVQVTHELAKALIVANMVPGQSETAAAQGAARARVAPFVLTIKEGETILRDGEIVDDLALEKLAAVGLLMGTYPWHSMAGTAILALAASGSLGLYLYFLKPPAVSTDRRLLLLLLVVVGVVLAAKLVIPGRSMYVYLFPVAAGPMILATLLDVSVAVPVIALLSILVSYVAGFSFGSVNVALGQPLDALQRMMVYLVGGLVGVLLAWKAQRLSRFFWAAVGITLATFLVLVGFWLLGGERQVSTLGWYVLASLGNGTLSSLLTIGAFVLLGLVFGIMTPWHIMELAQLNHPLMRRLVQEAPGTYYHSLIVGNLGEGAAEAVGADSLLVRVGAYYHDVGKVLRPGFFIENQLDGHNPHEALQPMDSAAIVIAHVAEGQGLAKSYHLPTRIRDFIAEHHGTRLASYFYRRAQRQGREVDPGPYTYPGPRPQTRETAIIMLADSVEAVVRSSHDHSPQKVDELVDQVIDESLAEGQLNECDLTLRNLKRIREVFKVTLRGVYHPRIEYPPQPPATPLRVPRRGRRWFSRAAAEDGPSHSSPVGPANKAGGEQ